MPPAKENPEEPKEIEYAGLKLASNWPQRRIHFGAPLEVAR